MKERLKSELNELLDTGYSREEAIYYLAKLYDMDIKKVEEYLV